MCMILFGMSVACLANCHIREEGIVEKTNTRKLSAACAAHVHLSWDIWHKLSTISISMMSQPPQENCTLASSKGIEVAKRRLFKFGTMEWPTSSLQQPGNTM